MELRQLAYLVAVADELSFSRAAERNYISQSAISHQIARLERELGVTLLERSTRAVSVTAAGERLLPIARQMLDLRTRAFAAVADPGSRIRLAANMSFARRSLTAVSAVRDDHPDVEIEFVIKNFDQRVEAVITGDVDIALIRGSVTDKRLRVHRLWVEELMVAMSDKHPLAGRTTVSLEELAEFPLILPPRKRQILLHEVINTAFTAAGLTIRFGPPIAPDHTAPLDLLNRPDSWSVLYDETPVVALAQIREDRGRLSVPVSALTRASSDATPERAAVIAELMKSLGHQPT
ncbi:LysR family transcriptional regulator [Williamsia sp. CHRR-6]|uniref:LysR family transcriptional regulator n=1 Tax=Williamsia sp. CHRR-6 TaxID=2835871 RepID=UPI001BDAC182|nr:LysR family transcriptional regulator [Williamsia sp. CHRR-6]MBT0567110.1 LysR family transcriptional regulator [Williamsia sp. CHRR-6]